MTPKFKDNFGFPNSVDFPNELNLRVVLTPKRETLNRCQPRNEIDLTQYNSQTDIALPYSLQLLNIYGINGINLSYMI